MREGLIRTLETTSKVGSFAGKKSRCLPSLLELPSRQSRRLGLTSAAWIAHCTEVEIPASMRSTPLPDSREQQESGGETLSYNLSSVEGADISVEELTRMLDRREIAGGTQWYFSGITPSMGTYTTATGGE